MNETASSLAITEKRSHNHRPGGCVGIFFQLFDRNRRFAKKKLFSKKLLPPARAKQASKKFGGDEKMPKSKLNLIADENSGSFPSMKKSRSCGTNLEQKNEMRAPSLVARLMGLESMPSMGRDKHKKAVLSDKCDDREEKFVDSMKDMNLEKGSERHESRPQKLQKTGTLENLGVTKYGGEAFQIKNVLSRSRKQHHSKFASPIRSPRLPSGKSSSRTSRLIDVATKILDPGLQNTNRAKCAITYSSSMHYPPKYEVKKDGTCDMSPELLNQYGYNACGTNSLKGHSCKNCGSVIDAVDIRSSEEEKPYVFASPASNFVNASSKGLGVSKLKTSIAGMEEVCELIFRNNQDQFVPLSAQMKNNLQTHGEICRDVSKVTQERRWPSSAKPCQSQKEESSSIALKATQAQTQMSLGRERIPFRGRQSNLEIKRVSSPSNAVNGEKDYVSLNRSLSGRTRPRLTTKVDNSTFDTDRNSCSRRDYTLSKLRAPVRKRTIVNGQAEISDSVSSTSGKQRNIKCDALTGKERRNTPSLDRNCIKNRTVCEKADECKNSDVISFTFSSPLRQKPQISTELEENTRKQDDFVTTSTSPRSTSILDENDGNIPLWKTLPFNGDALGAILEQKLKELTNQEEDELATGGTLPKRTTAMILQELISALTADQLVLPDVHRFSSDNQAAVKTEGTSLEFSHDVNHLSPGSVLEASFSNASCLSSSLDDSSGPKLATDFLDYSYDQQPQLKPHSDLFDSATSLKKNGNEILTDLVDHISMAFQSPNLASPTLTGSKLAHAKEVILNAELLFGYTSRHNSYGIIDILSDPFFLKELENDVIVCPSFIPGPGFEDTKDGRLKGFLFDCVIEYLDTKYGQYSNWGYKTWSKLRLSTNTEFMIQDVDNEIRKWTHLAGNIPDEIIEWEMSHSLGKWTDFDSEAYETGAEIDKDIFQALVEEIFFDFR